MLRTLVIAAALAATSEPFTLAHYTVPCFEQAADSLCETPGTHRETMGSVEIWWWPQGGTPHVWRTKNVAGLECTRDSLHLPASPMGLAKLYAIDAAGNRTCTADWAPFNESGIVSVPPRIGLLLARTFPTLDVSGRRVRPPLRAGIYFVRPPTGPALRFVVLE